MNYQTKFGLTGLMATSTRKTLRLPLIKMNLQMVELKC